MAIGQSGERPASLLEVELDRIEDPEDPAVVTWVAEWGLQDDSVGIEDNNQDLKALVDAVLEDARDLATRYDLTIQWTLYGDPAGDQPLEQTVASLGVSLPTRLTG